MCASVSELTSASSVQEARNSLEAPVNATMSALSVLSARNATYCGASDAACVSCYAAASNSSALLCLGANGCVCLSSCEPTHWRTRAAPACGLATNDSLTTVPEPGVAESGSTHGELTQQILTLVQVAGVFALMLIGATRQVGTSLHTCVRTRHDPSPHCSLCCCVR